MKPTLLFGAYPYPYEHAFDALKVASTHSFHKNNNVRPVPPTVLDTDTLHIELDSASTTQDPSDQGKAYKARLKVSPVRADGWLGPSFDLTLISSDSALARDQALIQFSQIQTIEDDAGKKPPMQIRSVVDHFGFPETLTIGAQVIKKLKSDGLLA